MSCTLRCNVNWQCPNRTYLLGSCFIKQHLPTRARSGPYYIENVCRVAVSNPSLGFCKLKVAFLSRYNDLKFFAQALRHEYLVEFLQPTCKPLLGCLESVEWPLTSKLKPIPHTVNCYKLYITSYIMYVQSKLLARIYSMQYKYYTVTYVFQLAACPKPESLNSEQALKDSWICRPCNFF